MDHRSVYYLLYMKLIGIHSRESEKENERHGPSLCLLTSLEYMELIGVHLRELDWRGRYTIPQSQQIFVYKVNIGAEGASHSYKYYTNKPYILG